jgi:hypothetical protein
MPCSQCSAVASGREEEYGAGGRGRTEEGDREQHRHFPSSDSLPHPSQGISVIALTGR